MLDFLKLSVSQKAAIYGTNDDFTPAVYEAEEELEELEEEEEEEDDVDWEDEDEDDWDYGDWEEEWVDEEE